MRKQLMASVLIPLGLGLAAVVHAQSSNVSSQSSAELFYMSQQLQGDVGRLQGRVEEQQHEITRLQQQGRNRYVDLDQRILDLSKSIEERPAAAATGAPAETSGGGQEVVQPLKDRKSVV